MWHSPHSAIDHIMGWRVTAYTPRAAVGLGPGAPPVGSAGLRTTEPNSKTEAASMTMVARPQSQSPTGHRGAVVSALT